MARNNEVDIFGNYLRFFHSNYYVFYYSGHRLTTVVSVYRHQYFIFAYPLEKKIQNVISGYCYFQTNMLTGIPVTFCLLLSIYKSETHVDKHEYIYNSGADYVSLL